MKKVDKKLQKVLGNFYSPKDILSKHAHYNMIYGERSNGKSFSVEEIGLTNYIKTGKQMAIIRRYDTDFTNKSGIQTTFNHFIYNKYRGNIVYNLTNGEWSDIVYYAGSWYLSKFNDKNMRIKDTRPFCYGFSLSGMEHNKSTSYPDITTILFDEFLTRMGYLQDEFILFQNVLSTIIRERTDVTIFMCGNTVNKYCPYFKEMGLDGVADMKLGEIRVYEFATYKGETLKVAVEYAKNANEEGKASDIYFAFKNPKLKMITGGMWEVAIYPHCPIKFTRDDIQFTYFIVWEEKILQCEVVQVLDLIFTYIHIKTTPLKNEEEDLIFSLEYSTRLNRRRRIDKPIDDLGKRIYWFFKTERVFYQDNEVGEMVRNYLMWCEKDKGFV
jgi:hypothetical protein